MKPILSAPAGLVCLCLSIGLSAAGCASKSGGDAGDRPQAAATVVMHLHSFEPGMVTIKSGQAVRWENKSPIWHTVTADPALVKNPKNVALPQGAAPFDSGKINAGSSYEHMFGVPGTYRYFCQPHESKGMVAEIVVK